MDRKEFDKGAVVRDGYERGLIRDAEKYKAAGIKEQVMLSFTTDPYHPGDTRLTARTLKVLRDHGMGFCTLTKGALAQFVIFTCSDLIVMHSHQH